MALKYLIVTALCVLQTACHQCRWTNTETKYNEIWTEINGMGKDKSTECFRGDRSLQMKIRLPRDVFGRSLEEGDALKTVHETFGQIMNIFRKNLEAVSWEDAQVASLNVKLHGLKSHLEQCMQPWKQDKGWKSYRKVRKYFKKLEDYLKDRQYSRCAWEMVKTKIETLLLQVRSLMVKL